jgi:hypothetical protein
MEPRPMNGLVLSGSTHRPRFGGMSRRCKDPSIPYYASLPDAPAPPPLAWPLLLDIGALNIILARGVTPVSADWIVW